MQNRYERVRFNRQTAILRLTAENDMFLSGIEVDKEGDEKASRGYDERLHLIDKLTITRRTPLRMNNKYGELEEAPK